MGAAVDFLYITSSSSDDDDSDDENNENDDDNDHFIFSLVNPLLLLHGVKPRACYTITYHVCLIYQLFPLPSSLLSC